MYAAVGITTDVKKDALVVPVNAVVDLGGRRGVFQPQGDSAVFHSVQVGTEEKDQIEILGGIKEGDYVITTGAGALRDGDRVIIPGRTGGGGRGRRGADAASAGQPTGDGPSQGGQFSGAREGGRPGECKRENTPDGRGAAREGSTGRDGGRRYGGDGSGSRYGGDGSGRRSGGAPPPPNPASAEKKDTGPK